MGTRVFVVDWFSRGIHSLQTHPEHSVLVLHSGPVEFNKAMSAKESAVQIVFRYFVVGLVSFDDFRACVLCVSVYAACIPSTLPVVLVLTLKILHPNHSPFSPFICSIKIVHPHHKNSKKIT